MWRNCVQFANYAEKANELKQNSNNLTLLDKLLSQNFIV